MQKLNFKNVLVGLGICVILIISMLVATGVFDINGDQPALSIKGSTTPSIGQINQKISGYIMKLTINKITPPDKDVFLGQKDVLLGVYDMTTTEDVVLGSIVFYPKPTTPEGYMIIKNWRLYLGDVALTNPTIESNRLWNKKNPYEKAHFIFVLPKGFPVQKDKVYNMFLYGDVGSGTGAVNMQLSGLAAYNSARVALDKDKDIYRIGIESNKLRIKSRVLPCDGLEDKKKIP